MTSNLHNKVLAFLDKSKGKTSHDYVDVLRKKLSLSKVGHGGTLDPFATGMLPMFFGKWTRLSSLFTHANKRYTALLKLGQKTDTGDLTGNVVHQQKVPPLTQAQCRLLECAFSGKVVNLPIPIYSALKVDGVPMYELARKGKISEPQRYRDQHIYSIKVELAGTDLLAIDVECSHGTYIRSLAEALAEKLKTVGHLVELRRVSYWFGDKRKDQFSGKMVELESFLEDPDSHSLSLNDLSKVLPTFSLNQTKLRDFLVGRMRRAPLKITGWYLVECFGNIIAVVLFDQGKIDQRIFIQELQDKQAPTSEA